VSRALHATAALPLLLLALLHALLLAACAATSPEPVRYALVYGVSRYTTAAEGVRPNLSLCDDDARAMAALLEANGYAVTLRTDADASRANLELDLAALAGEVAEGDLFLLYFSGHGGMLEDFVGDPSSAPEYAADSTWIFPHGSIDALWNISLDAAIADRDLEALVGALPCSKRVVILDTCNSGGFIESGADTDALPADYSLSAAIDRNLVFQEALDAYLDYSPTPAGTGLPPSTALVLAAAGGDEESYEDGDLGHGVFTYFLLESAASGDLNGDGWITALEAYAYAVSGAGQWNRRFSTSYRFLPHVSGGAVDFALFEVP
jgi:hypothetical protein